MADDSSGCVWLLRDSHNETGVLLYSFRDDFILCPTDIFYSILFDESKLEGFIHDPTWKSDCFDTIQKIDPAEE